MSGAMSSEEDVVVVLGSDGIFDVLSDAEADGTVQAEAIVRSTRFTLTTFGNEDPTFSNVLFHCLRQAHWTERWPQGRSICALGESQGRRRRRRRRQSCTTEAVKRKPHV